MRQTLATLATLACARAWPALDEALRDYREGGQRVDRRGPRRRPGARGARGKPPLLEVLATDPDAGQHFLQRRRGPRDGSRRRPRRPRLPADEKGDQPLRRPAHALHVRPVLSRRSPGRAVRAGVHRRVQAPERVLAPPRRLRVDAHRPQHAEGSSGKAPGREMN